MTRLANLTAIASIMIVLPACSRQATEEAVEQAEEAAGSAMDTAKEMGEQAADVASDVGEKTEQAFEALGEEFTTAYTAAREAVEGIADGPEMLSKVTGLFAGAKESLESIRDSETAQAAMSRLDELEQEVEELGTSMKNLPGEAKSAIVSLVEKGMAQLQSLVEKVKGMSDLDEAIKARLDKFIEQIASLRD